MLKVENLKEIHVRPVLLRKNGVCLALYGLSSVKVDTMLKKTKSSNFCMNYLRPTQVRSMNHFKDILGAAFPFF